MATRAESAERVERSEQSGVGSAGDRSQAIPPLGVVEPRPCRVLVVDDSANALKSMALLLEQLGHEVVTASSGREALHKAHTFRPQVILCDIGMPGMDGYAVARALAADPELAAARRIALSGYGQDEDRARARDAGFDEYVTKPINLDTLACALRGGSTQCG